MEKIYQIDQPDISKIDGGEYIPTFFSDPATFEAVRKTEAPEYLHWKDIKYKNWIPEKFQNDKKSFWALVKILRRMHSRKSKIRDQKNNFFSWKKLNHYEEMLHEIDLDMSNCLLDFPNISKKDHEKYRLIGITEEAIASSQLEGAHTTRKAAKKMIQENRKPRTPDERMIYNNFLAMSSIQDKYKNEKMSLDILFDLHRLLTSGTNSLKESEQGSFRSDSDNIVITKGNDPTIISYIAPPIKFVEEEIKQFIAFANDELEEETFIHPIIKAIMLHFWIGLLHPFVDGNGRLARGLFYWYLARKGYWAFTFLPISIAIKSAPAQYSESYILSEQDDNDLTYFIDYHLRKITQSVEGFKVYIKNKSQNNQKFDALVDEVMHKHKTLNRRQAELLINFHNNSKKHINVTVYVSLYRVTKATAIKDLKGLVQLKLVESERRGKNVFYTPTKANRDLLED